MPMRFTHTHLISSSLNTHTFGVVEHEIYRAPWTHTAPSNFHNKNHRLAFALVSTNFINSGLISYTNQLLLAAYKSTELKEKPTLF